MTNKKSLAVTGEGLSRECRDRLCELGFEVVVLPPYERLGRGVDSHADLMLFPVDDKIFIYRELSERLPELMGKLRCRGYKIVELDAVPSEKYPQDIATNCLKVGKYLFCKKKYTADRILDCANETGYTVVNTNQGYARCCACPVGDGGMLTADPSILKSARSVSLKTLPITEGYVRLEGFSHGFIGGACGILDGTLYLAGDLNTHPDGERIESFCRDMGVSVLSLSQEPLTDVGSIFFFKDLQ